ncbi:MAG TPA: uL15 family ribosomal protein, partial [Planctomycetota bacterium]|nr:uL15 family ribosomal protein [Planctomycetota bacterium]
GQTPLMRRIPKRGFSNDDFGQRFCVLNIEDLNCFDDGATVDPKVLVQTGIVKQPLDGIKILGDGELEKKLTVKAHRFSKSAIAKLQAKGGEAVTMLPPKEMGPKKKKLAAKRAAGLTAKPKKAEEAAPEAAAAAPAAKPAKEKAPKPKKEGEA